MNLICTFIKFLKINNYIDKLFVPYNNMNEFYKCIRNANIMSQKITQIILNSEQPLNDRIFNKIWKEKY